MEYRRAWRQGGCYFFTVVTYKRQPILANPENISLLRKAFNHIRGKRHFTMDGIVVLPGHLHCIWKLPENDSDFATRWRLIKHFFSRSCSVGRMGEAERTHQSGADKVANPSRTKKREKPVWQRRYWEHLIRDEQDWRKHMDYIHYNPVKHGIVNAPIQWPYSSFKQCVKKGWYSSEWGSSEPGTIAGMDIE